MWLGEDGACRAVLAVIWGLLKREWGLLQEQQEDQGWAVRRPGSGGPQMPAGKMGLVSWGHRKALLWDRE